MDHQSPVGRIWCLSARVSHIMRQAQAAAWSAGRRVYSALTCGSLSSVSRSLVPKLPLGFEVLQHGVKDTDVSLYLYRAVSITGMHEAVTVLLGL